MAWNEILDVTCHLMPDSFMIKYMNVHVYIQCTPMGQVTVQIGHWSLLTPWMKDCIVENILILRKCIVTSNDGDGECEMCRFGLFCSLDYLMVHFESIAKL